MGKQIKKQKKLEKQHPKLWGHQRNTPNTPTHTEQQLL